MAGIYIGGIWYDIVDDTTPREARMPLFEVIFTGKVWKKLPDGAQVQNDILIGRVENIIANNQNTAIAIAARKLDGEIDPDVFANCTITPRALTT